MAPEAEREVADTSGVLVGLSGGIDSSVAASLLVEQGHRVVGVTLWLRSDPGSTHGLARGSAEAVRRAKAVAECLGIAHHVVDARERFSEQVVGYFVDEHAAGRTPNPCAKCNARVRFGLLADVASRMGLARIATGHYARLLGETRSLARGVDTSKDQSYVLAEVSPELLRQAVFPLGAMTKTEVRSLAAERGLARYSGAESQEICFIPDGDHRRFLRERLGDRPGRLVSREGEVLGRHKGTYNFTIGQRRGIGIAHEEPRYVVAVVAKSGEVVVGDAREILAGAVTIDEIVHHRPATGPTTAQLRSTGGAVPAHMTGPDRIVLEEPVAGIAPGQTAVLYEGDAVVLAGTILATEKWGGPGTASAQKGDK